MGATFFDLLTGHFIAAFQSGGAQLNAIMLPLMSIIGFVAWSAATLHIMGSSGGKIEVLIGAATVALSIAVHLFIAANFNGLATGLFNWFAGLAASIGGFSPGAFLSPSTVFTMGFVVGKPILDFLLKIRTWFTTNPVTMILMMIAYLGIIWTFIKQTRHVIMTILSFHLAVMTAPVLIPWALLTQTKTLAEMSISWIFTTSVQIFLVSAVLGLGSGLIATIAPFLTAGGDPTLFSAACMAAASWILLVLTDQVVVQSAAAGARFGLGLTGHTLIPPALGTVASGAIQYAVGGVAGVAAGVVSRMSSALAARRGRT